MWWYQWEESLTFQAPEKAKKPRQSQPRSKPAGAQRSVEGRKVIVIIQSAFEISPFTLSELFCIFVFMFILFYFPPHPHSAGYLKIGPSRSSILGLHFSSMAKAMGVSPQVGCNKSASAQFVQSFANQYIFCVQSSQVWIWKVKVSFTPGK